MSDHGGVSVMDKELIRNKVKEVVVDHLGLLSTFDGKGDFIEDLGADYLDVVEIIMHLEEKFGVCISEENEDKMTSVDTCVEILSGLV